MRQIKNQLHQLTMPMQELDKSFNESMKPIIEASKATSKPFKSIQEDLKSINTMSNVIKELSIKYPNNQAKIFIDTIKANNHHVKIEIYTRRASI